MYKLRIRQHDVGRRTPFPLLYLFTQKEFPEFRQVFETFIGFSVRNTYSIEWNKLRVYHHDGRQVSWGTTRDQAAGLGEMYLTNLIPDLMDPQIKWQAAVPLLTVQRSSKAEPLRDGPSDAPAPAYLSSRGNWQDTSDGPPTERPVYPGGAYLVTKSRVFVPVCMACPRILHHDAGRCHIGDEVCFSSLNRFAADNRFAHHINTYEARHGVRPHELAVADTDEAP